MKRFLLIFFTLFATLVSAQNRIIQYENEVFKVLYSESFEQPLKLEYVVDCWDGEHSRAGMNFYKVEGIHTSDNADYRNNEWDKGHLAPAAAFKCDEEELFMTFSYLNCALQHEGLNRGPWKDLEAYERELAERYGKVKVIIDLEFANFCENRLETGAVVPSAFKKTIMVDLNPDPDVFELGKKVYVFPNTNLRGEDYNDYQIQ